MPRNLDEDDGGGAGCSPPGRAALLRIVSASINMGERTHALALLRMSLTTLLGSFLGGS